MSHLASKPATQYEAFQTDTNDFSTPRNNYSEPQSHVQMNNMPQVVVQSNSTTQQIQTFNMDPAIEPWTWCNLITSMFAVCCCPFFGFIATVMSILAYVDHQGKEYERYRAKKSCAYGFGISAIVLGSISLVITIIAVVLVAQNSQEIINTVNNNYNG